MYNVRIDLCLIFGVNKDKKKTFHQIVLLKDKEVIFDEISPYFWVVFFFF